MESREGGSCAIFLQVPALEAGRISYNCSMGMYGASLTVIDAQDGVLDEPPRT